MSPETIRAEIIGDDKATALGLSVRGRTPVLKLCRELIAAGHDPASPLEAYRGSTLCLRIASIGKGAGLDVMDRPGCGQPRFVRYNPLQDSRDFVGVSSQTTKSEAA